MNHAYRIASDKGLRPTMLALACAGILGSGLGTLAAPAFAADVVIPGGNVPYTLSVATLGPGDITQSGALTVGDWSLFSAEGSIFLDNAGNDFVGVVYVAATGTVKVVDSNALALSSLSAQDLDVTSQGALSLESGAVYRHLSANSNGGAITQSTGGWRVGGNSTIDAGTGNIQLDSFENDFVGTVSLTGHNASIRDRNELSLGVLDVNSMSAISAGALNLGSGSIGGHLDAAAGGAIIQNGALLVAGTSEIDAGTSDITLTNAGNDFSGGVSVTGGAVSIRDANALHLDSLSVQSLDAATHGALSLGSGTIAGNLWASVNGGIVTQGGALTVGGISTIDAGSGAITLGNVGNDFAGLVHLAGGTTVVSDANALSLGTLNVGSLQATSGGELSLGSGSIAGNLSAWGNGSITQSGALAVGGGTSIQVGTLDITLTDAGNDFSGGVSLSGGAVSIRDANALSLDVFAVQSLDVTTTGALNLGLGTIAGNLWADTNGGAVTQLLPITVGGTSTIDAGTGAITLAEANNNFAGPVHLTGGATTIRDANALILGTVDVASLTATSGGPITQGAAASVAGDSTIDAGAGDIVLDQAGNDFAGTISLAGRNISIRDANDMDVVSLTNGTNGIVDLAAGGTLTMAPGAIDTGTADLSLQSQGGAFSTPGALSGHDVFLAGRDGLVLGHDIHAGGELRLESAAAIMQVGGALATGTLVGSTSGTVTLGSAGNAIDTLGDFAAGDFSLANSVALSIDGEVSLDGALTLDNAAGISLLGAIDTGAGTLLGAGTSMTVGNGGTAGTLRGDLHFDDTLAFDRIDTVTYAGSLGGGGTLRQQGSGTLVLDGDSSGFAGGRTFVDAGTLVVGSARGNGASLAGDVTVTNGASLGGHGLLQDNVVVQSGAHLAPGTSIGTLTVGGNLQLDQGSILDFEFGAPGPDFSTPGVSDRVDVAGNLSIDGATLNVLDAGMGAGLYRILSWGGSLSQSNGGLVLGSVPAGEMLQLQVLGKSINVLSASGLELNFWNANGAATASQLGGGSGTWSATSPHWTDADATLSAAMQPQPGFAIFGGSSGTVTVDNGAGAVVASGMQFASDGYRLTGDTLTLVGSAPTIRVGDGSAAGAAMTATIDTAIAGSDGLRKADAGTLVLTGDNTYAGGTTITGGTLQVSADANLGAAGGGIVLDGGSLAGTGTFATVRDIALGAAGGRLLADTAFTVDGAISGAGTLHTSGLVTLTNGGNSVASLAIDDGTLALAGAGVAPGTVAMAAGSVFDISQATAGASVSGLAGGGHVALGSRTLRVAGGTSVFDGTFGHGGIGGGTGGSLMLAGGSLTLAGANPFTGAPIDLFVDAGSTLGIAASVQNAAIGELHGDGHIHLDSSTLLLAGGAFDGVIGGEGGGLHIGGGALDLGGVNTYTGATTIAGGASLVLTGAGSIAGSSGVTVDGTFDVSGTDDGATINGLRGSGDVVLGDRNLAIGGGSSTFGGDFSGSGVLHLQGGSNLDWSGTNGNFHIDGGSALKVGSIDFGGQVSGDGNFVKGGEGALVMGNGGSGFAGTTRVDSGTLVIGAAALLGGDVSVAQGAILGGHGGVGGSVTNAGTMAPGNSIGTFSIGGDYVQTATGVLEIEARADGQSDRLVVGGSASLDGSMLVLAADGDWRPETGYRILTAGGGISGQFGAASSSLVFLDPLLDYGNDAVTLTLRRNDIDFASAAASANQAGIAAAADALGWGNPVYTELTTLDAAQAAAAFDALSGEIHASARGMLLEDSRHLEQAVVLQLAAIPSGADAGGWVSGWGHSARLDGDGNAAEVDGEGNGVVVGFDAPIGDRLRVGALVASSRFSVDATAHASRTEADGRHAGVYARYDAPSASLQAGILRGSHDIDSRRGVAFGGYEANLQGEAEADTTQYFLDASRVFDRGSVQLVPFANLARVEVDSDGFDETGGDAALHVGGGVLARTFASAGLHAEWEAGAATRLWGSVAWLHASGDGRAVAQQRFVDGTAPFVVSGADLAGDTALLDLGLRWRPGMRTTLEAAYNGRFGGGLRDQGGRVSLRVAF